MQGASRGSTSPEHDSRLKCLSSCRTVQISLGDVLQSPRSEAQLCPLKMKHCLACVHCPCLQSCKTRPTTNLLNFATPTFGIHFLAAALVERGGSGVALRGRKFTRSCLERNCGGHTAVPWRATTSIPWVALRALARLSRKISFYYFFFVSNRHDTLLLKPGTRVHRLGCEERTNSFMLGRPHGA